jgi:hypothetical protein
MSWNEVRCRMASRETTNWNILYTRTQREKKKVIACDDKWLGTRGAHMVLQNKLEALGDCYSFGPYYTIKYKDKHIDTHTHQRT